LLYFIYLIFNSQETEHTLEELQHAFKETKLSMDTRTGQLQGQIDELHDQIVGEESRAKSLQIKRMMAAEIGTPTDDPNAVATSSGQTTQLEKEQLLAELNVKVRAVYESCGFDASSKPSMYIYIILLFINSFINFINY
jgi:hypothetical protein